MLFNSPPPPPSTNPTVITQMLVFLFLSLFHLPSPLPFLPYLIGDFSRISAGPDGIRTLQRVSVRLLLRQCDGRLRSWAGWMSRWVVFCVPLWPVSVSRVLKKKRKKGGKKSRSYQAVCSIWASLSLTAITVAKLQSRKRFILIQGIIMIIRRCINRKISSSDDPDKW